jgi:hypothetical protein
MSTPTEIAQAPASAGPADGVVEQPVVFDAAALAADNARLRAELLAENERLRAALAESQAAGLTFQGLTDEDVRRLEHPEEFAQEYVARGEHDSLAALVNELHAKVAAAGAAGIDTAPKQPGDVVDPRDAEIADLRAQLAAAQQAEVDEDAPPPPAHTAP